MSNRVLVPTNLFYHWQDPWPDPNDPEKGFPQPNTGDVYLNVASQTLRVFYEGDWHDAQAAAPPPEEAEDLTDVFVQSVELTSGTAVAPAGGPEGGIVGSIYIQY